MFLTDQMHFLLLSLFQTGASLGSTSISLTPTYSGCVTAYKTALAMSVASKILQDALPSYFS